MTNSLNIHGDHRDELSKDVKEQMTMMKQDEIAVQLTVILR